MFFLKCCVGADPRPPPEQIRPVGASANPNRRIGGRSANHVPGGSSLRPDSLGNKKLKMPNEVFFDPSKPDGQLSSVTDPPTSAREFSEAKKKKKDGKDRGGTFSFFFCVIFSFKLCPCAFLHWVDACQVRLACVCVWDTDSFACDCSDLAVLGVV